MIDMITIQGAKAGQGQSSRPPIADDTIASISRLKMVIGLTEGEAKGLANGAKSIMLESTPLEDENGNQNFEGVEWEIRHGTVDQTYIAGMPNASSEIGIGVTVRSDTPWIRSITDTQLSSINVNLSFPLLKQVTDKGEVKGVSVDYVIEVQTDGNGYVPVVTKALTAKTSGRYQRTHNVTLPDAQSNWQIRVRKITADGDNESLFNTMQVDSIAEVIDGKFNYPHTAHLYLSFDARTFSNIPKVSVDMLGVYVQVPTNYDTETRTSTGIWQGQFKLGYTTNPAWHYYNLITNDRYGLGDKLQAFMIDKWALEHIARICDEPVDDGKGGLEPRFECNLYLQKAEDAYQVLQHIAGIFRGMSFWNGSKIFVDADTPRDCEYVITRANVVGGVFSKTGSAASDRHTIAQVAWSDPDNAYETEYAMVRNERAIAQQGINVLDLAAVGCTSEGQAYRMGLAALLAEQNRTQTVSFAMGLDGSLPIVGSRIDIPDMMFTGANSSGRISSVNANRTVITVDRDNVPATVGDKLMVNLESGKAQSRVITAISGRAITVALAFDPVAPENVWSIISDELPTMPFIVMSVTSAEDGTQYNYTAMQYDPTMYAQIDNGTIIEQRPPVPTNNPYIINAPETVTLDSRHRVAQGITVTTLEITWSQVTDAVAYDVEWRKDDGDWIKLPRTGNISAEIDGIYSGNYLARVRAVSAFDAISKPATSMLTAIVGKVGLPPTIVGLTATGVLFGIDLKWGFGAGSGDSDYTEVQVGSAPDVNVAPLTQASYPTNTHTITGLQGNLSQSYRARLVDKLGNKSAWSSWVTATTDNSADKVLDLIQGQINEDSLNSGLTEKIADIQINKESIDTETQNRVDAIFGTNKRIDDNFIVDTDVEYYLSSSATTPTGGVWQTTAPAFQQSKYMFSRTKTTLGNGSFDYSPSANGTNITGAKGDTGAQGVAGRDGTNGVDGNNGIDGLEGADGSDGINGKNGVDGVSSYTHLAYGTSSTGANFSVSHYPNATYIGVYVDSLPADSTTPSKYKWSLIKGADGTNGVAGQKGADGLTPYFHVAYANSIDGTVGFSTTVSVNKTHIGQYTDNTQADGNSPSKYKWTLIKGADGAKGIDGVNGIDGLEGDKGDQGIQGVKGADGISSYTHLAYGTSASGAGFSKFHFTNATHIGLYVDNIAADSDTPSKYNWSLIKGADGANGIAGAKGADGLTPYLHIAYATNADGTAGFSTTVSAGKTYIGQYADNVQADSTTSSKYKWTLIKGATGSTGAIGQGVDGIVEEYAINMSKTVAPTNWSTTPPVWSKGYYVWTRSKITYKNPTEVKYTIPVVGSVWDAITETKTDFINFEDEITDELGTQGETLQGIISDYKPEYFDKTKYFSSQAQQWTYAKSVARDNYAANERVTNLQSEFADSSANVTNTLFTLSEKDKSIASDVTQLYTETGSNYGLIQDINIAISTPTTGLAAKVTELQSSSQNNATAATNAKLSADAAAIAAGNKGEVIYQSQTPAAARQLVQNLWIDTTGGKNTPKRWDGSAWVVVTDKAAIDAQIAATKAIADAKAADDKAVAAQGTANTAKTDAKAADDKAVAAQQAATAALSSLSDISSDNKLTAVEKQQVKLIFDDIQRTHADVLNRAAKYSVSTSEYTSAYNDLSSYITPKLSDMSSTNTIVRSSFNAKFDTLFLKRADLDTAIVNAAKLVADNAQATADAANQKLLPENLGSLVEQSGAFSDEFGAIAGNITNIQGVIDGQKTAIEVTSAVGNAEKLKNEIAKARLDKDVTKLNAQNTALTNSINAYDTKVTELTNKRNAATDVALKAEYNRQIADINAAKADLTAQKAAIADQVSQLNGEKEALDSLKVTETGIKAQYTIKIDAGGAVVGYGLVLDKNNVSNFNIRANNINFLPPANGGDDGVSQLVVRNTSSVIDGVTVPAGLYTRNFYAPRASIDTIQIKDAAIKSAQIDNLAVTTGKIANLAVDTLQIAGNAVTVAALFFSEQDDTFNIAATEQEIAGVTINAEGGSVAVSFGFERIRVYDYGDLTGATMVFKIKRGNTVLRTIRFSSTLSSNGRHNSRINANYITLATMLDSPPSGNSRYSVTASTINTNESVISLDIQARSLMVSGAKR